MATEGRAYRRTNGEQAAGHPFTHIVVRVAGQMQLNAAGIPHAEALTRGTAKVGDNRIGCQALVTGESIGQVASQTMDGLTCTNAVCSLPVFRPLIGFDKTEIMDYAERIGTYETSILPYEDCCTIFTPRHPQTKPRVDQLEQSETLLDGEALIERALTGIEVVDIRP